MGFSFGKYSKTKFIVVFVLIVVCIDNLEINRIIYCPPTYGSPCIIKLEVS